MEPSAPMKLKKLKENIENLGNLTELGRFIAKLHGRKEESIILEEIKQTLTKCMEQKMSENTVSAYYKRTTNICALLPLVLLEHIVSYCDRNERNEYYHICKLFQNITQNVNRKDIYGYELNVCFWLENKNNTSPYVMIDQKKLSIECRLSTNDKDENLESQINAETQLNHILSYAKYLCMDASNDQFQSFDSLKAGLDLFFKYCIPNIKNIHILEFIDIY